MKEVINGLLYNTETAEKIHSWDNGYYQNDFNYCKEELYKTRKGNYFLYGDGGAASKYAKHVGNTSSGSSEIIPLDLENTILWLEHHDGSDVLVDKFNNHIKEA